MGKEDWKVVFQQAMTLADIWMCGTSQQRRTLGVEAYVMRYIVNFSGSELCIAY
jgi:hypothetical protein